MAQIHIGSYGEISILGDAALQARVTTLRQRVSGKAGRTPRGKQIFTALVRWQGEVREALQAQHGQRFFDEYKSYALDIVPLDALIEAERLHAEGQALPTIQTYQCSMRGCQARVRTSGDLCARCAHDEE